MQWTGRRRSPVILNSKIHHQLRTYVIVYEYVVVVVQSQTEISYLDMGQVGMINFNSQPPNRMFDKDIPDVASMPISSDRLVYV